MGRDFEHPEKVERNIWFQFTRPAWGATGDRSSFRTDGFRFQFTRPAWGATHQHSI